MTGDQHLQLGKKQNIALNLGQLKSGMTSAVFGNDEAMLSIFDSCDTNKNKVLDENEVGLLKDKLTQVAGEDQILSEKEAKKLLEQEQQALQAQGQSKNKTKLDGKNLFNFANALQNWSKATDVKSSVVEGDKRVVTYEDGAQEVINQDGSKVITKVSGGIKTVQTKSADGKLQKEEVFDEENGTTDVTTYGENGQPISTVRTKEGSTETVQYAEDGKTVTSHTLVEGDNTYEIGVEGFANGRVTKEITGTGDEQQVTEYNYTGENDFTKTLTYQNTETVAQVKNGEVVSVDATQYDENHNKVQSQNIAQDGTVTTSLYNKGQVVYQAVTEKNGNVTETSYNESGHKTSQTITKGKNVYVANYDGKGNTIAVVQNGETIPVMGQKFHRTISQLVNANRGHVYKDGEGNPYFLVGDEVKVPGEFSADHRGLRGRNSAETEIAEYASQEEQRVAERLQGKEQKSVTIKKDYANWYKFAEEQLKSEGVANPTQGQINDRANELLLLNPNVQVPKKGIKITAIKTDAEINAEKRAEERRQATEVRVGVVNSMVGDYNKAVKSFNAQMDKDGWAADVADAVSYIWNNDLWSATGNTARQVRQDLAEYKSDIDALKNARKAGDGQFNAKFKEIFGVEYSQKNVESYNASKQRLENASTAIATERYVTQKMDGLFAKGNVNEIKKEMKTLLGLSDADMAQYEKTLREKGKSLNMATLKELYSDVKKGLAQNTKNATGGKTVAQLKADMDSKYKTAYGNRKDIVKRVADYNASQDTGAAVVKSAAKIVGSAVIAVASGGTATGLLIAAVGTTALSFGVDASDMASDGLDHSASEYGQVAVNAAVDGGAQLISGGTSHFLKGANVGRAVRYTAQAATDMTLDCGLEYVRTGEVSLSTAIFSVASSVGGEYLGDVLEARATKKALEVDESAVAREFGSIDQGWLGETTDAHHRYRHELSADQIGNVPSQRSVINGVEVTSADARGLNFDVPMSAHRQSVADVNNLLGSKNAGQDFGQGLVVLEDRFRANPTMASGVGARADNVRPYGTFASNDKVKAMGLESRLDVVQDAGQMAGMVYGDRDINFNGWTQTAKASADNGFNAVAVEKDGVVMVLFRGSDDMGDLRVDHQMLSGKVPDQFNDACAFMEQVRAANPDAKIVVSGHSLGGALTELVASKYDDVLGVSFDAVGTRSLVNATEGLTDNHNTINYIVQGDIISNATEHVGSVTLVNEVVDISRGGNLQSPHAIGNFMGSADNSLAGVEAGFVQRNLDRAATTRATAEAKGMTLNSAIANSQTGAVEFDDKTFKRIQSQFAMDVEGLNVDLDAMQRQINAVTNPQQKATLQGILDKRKVAITDGANITARSTVLQEMTGDEINDILARDFGFTEPGFLGGDTPSQLIEMDKPTKFVRVFNDESSFAKGSWLMPYDEVVGKTPAEIKDFFALPAMPKYIVEVEMPAGAKMYTGKCNPLEGWGNGGGTQYFLIGDKRPTLYGKMVALPQ